MPSIRTLCLAASVAAALALAALVFAGRSANADMAIGLSAGEDHTCAVNGSNGVICWGYNGTGQLGVGEINGPEICTNEPSLPGPNDDYPCSSIPMQVIGLSSGVDKVASGRDFTCALKTGGTVSCWGRNDVGQLGNGSLGQETCIAPLQEVSCDTAPVSVDGITDAVDIVAGSSHACALLSTGA